MVLGTTSSTGVAFGNIFILEDVDETQQEAAACVFDTQAEMARFNEAVNASLSDLEKLREEIKIKIGEKEEKIFEAQALILEDPALIDAVKNRILTDRLTATEAVKLTIIELEQQFLNIEDKTIRQRIADIKDVGIRILRQLNQKKSEIMKSLTDPVILVTRELLPSQAAQLDREKILAILTEKGGINSHASIIARSLDIPAVVGVKNLLSKARKSNKAFVDAYQGIVHFNPDSEMMELYERLKHEGESRKEIKAGNGPVQTSDGTRIFLYANIGKVSELNVLKDNPIEGVGLLRTEFLIMQRQTPPAVEDFASVFKTIMDFMYPLPVNIRLVDIGSDKTFPFISAPRENNPVLGNRGIRFLLSNPHLLKSQIQGILEASTAGNARVLIPMVTTLEEIKEVKTMLRRMEMELTEQGQNIKAHIPLGMMVETPAAALMAQKFAREVDFISIGTNDLVQYVLAADRDNELVQDIYSYLNPAILEMIMNCVKGGEKAGIEVTVCGEMATDTYSIPVLLGLGIRRLSVAVNQLERVRNMVYRVNLAKAEKMARKALKASSAKEVEDLVKDYLAAQEKLYPENFKN